MAGFVEIVSDAVNEKADCLNALGRYLWDNPETAMEEFKAHERISDFLESEGFSVQRNYIIPTAFRAAFGGKTFGRTRVVFMCEYDALPDIGHACGHNLMAECAVAAGIAVKKVLQRDPSLVGKVVVLGTPAEEALLGKVHLLRGGSFDDAAFALIAHPTLRNDPCPSTSGLLKMNVEFKGKAAHAGSVPWKGINALDAAMGAYTFVAMLQRRMRHVWKIVASITDGGSAPNVIPDMTKLEYDLWAPNFKQLVRLKERVEACVTSGGDGAGCVTKITLKGRMLKDVMAVSTLTNVYQKNAESLGMKFRQADKERTPEVVTDAGNVSYVVPMIRPIFGLDTQADINTKEFAEAAGTSDALDRSLVAARALALTIIEVMRSPALYKEIREEFLAMKSKAS
ncbi:unnamed protein product [Ixodes hexagonus]